MLILLADIRKKFLWLWLTGAILSGLFIFSRTLTGANEGMETGAWLWYFINILPTLSLLFVAVIGNRNSSKVIKRSTFILLFTGVVCYLLFLLVTLFGKPDTMRDQSMEDYLHLSYVWLLPFQSLLLCLFGLLFFRKEAFFQPSAAIMQEYVGKKAEYARRIGSLLQAQAFETLIQPNGLGDTLAILHEGTGTTNKDIVLLKSQYANWKQSRDLNIAPPEQLQRELNRMTLAVIDYIDNLSV